ncbi:uncharacterized protein CC84DRAFT_1141828 [Paraphaeosphaeria sporulosa]|uniref:Cell wall protein n=1 Tax=Paraphaeosphaeria sporulosa TaxID=1460663 RepID=A0A177CMS2_9PLEO|nr:uncharacterized protein CC84DRAFT_1141828 [Paraphaeosphaeria sporulosa]OAG08835.1 hypothetical protein CC84DRAFT_1141828 [Paraphaeosphaeria sporulosa]
MPSTSKMMLTLALLTVAYALPTPQLAGEGAAANSLLSSTDNGLDTIDGQSTSGAADLGAQVGNAEASTLEAVGSAIPKRQLDKISNGAQTLSNAAGTGAATSTITTGLDSIDGILTSGAANTGADLGNTEAGTLEAAGSSVPTSLRI